MFFVLGFQLFVNFSPFRTILEAKLSYSAFSYRVSIFLTEPCADAGLSSGPNFRSIFHFRRFQGLYFLIQRFLVVCRGCTSLQSSLCCHSCVFTRAGPKVLPSDACRCRTNTAKVRREESKPWFDRMLNCVC